MKQSIISLAKGLLFSAILLTTLIFFLAFLMYKTQWNDSVISPLIIISYCLSAFIGSFYFAKHTEKRRFLWGLLFGTIFFLLYVAVILSFTFSSGFSTERLLTFFAFSLGAGCLGGMFSWRYINLMTFPKTSFIIKETLSKYLLIFRFVKT